MQKLIILLVACLVLATYCQSSTSNNDPCNQFTSKSDCSTHTGTEVSCNWCESASTIADAGLCQTTCTISGGSPTLSPTTCSYASRASVICPDGSRASSTCNNGQWTAPVCPSSSGDSGSGGSTTCTGCSASFQASNPPQVCSDGTTVAGPVCNLQTCQYEYTTCPNCAACPESDDDSITNGASFVCGDGSVGGPTCNYTTCKYFLRACPAVSSTTTAPTCPGGSQLPNCLMNPCSSASQSSPTCVPNWCNCTAAYFNSDGSSATYTPPTTSTTSCSASDCTGDKPSTTCSNAQFFCVPQFSSSASRDSSPACAWIATCPVTIPTSTSTSSSPTQQSCVGGCSGLAAPTIAIACHDGTTATPQCTPVSYPYASASSTSTLNTSCSWSLTCPESSSSGDSVTCVSRGVCGELCVASGSVTALAAATPNTATCASSPSCQQSCFLANQVGTGCAYVANRGCQATLSTDSYLQCLAACAGSTTPSGSGNDDSAPTCSGHNICTCNYATGCFFCQQNITTNYFSLLVGRCLNTTSGDTCTATGASIFPSAPQQCSIFADSDATPVTTSATANALLNLNPAQLQAQFAQQFKANSNSAAQNIAVVIKNILNANGTSAANAQVQLLISVIGNSGSSLTAAQQQYITSVLIPSLKTLDATNAANLNTATYAQVSTSNSNVKRSIQQSSSNGDYVVTVASTASPQPESSATGHVVSFVTMIVAVIVLVLNY